MSYWGRWPRGDGPTKEGDTPKENQGPYLANMQDYKEAPWRYIHHMSCADIQKYVLAGIQGTAMDGTSVIPEHAHQYKNSIAECRRAMAGVSSTERLNCTDLALNHFNLNCEDMPNGLAVYNQVDSDNCEAWVLVLAANGYNRTFMWIVMLILMIWTFLGVNIVADIFMAAIEVITAKTKEFKKVREGGDEIVIRTKVWNPTVANLSLMALGSSAPEIMLAVLDTVQTLGATPGELGPSTIVGSAAFNLFVISAVCVTALPAGEVKVIEQTGVFVVTATSSILAYVWMVVVLSDENVSMGEAIGTFALFPILLGLAYAADKGLCSCCGGTQVKPEKDENARLLAMAFENADGSLMANKEEIALLIKEQKAKTGKSAEEIARELQEKAEAAQKFSRNHYRINAMKSLSGQRHARPRDAVESAVESDADGSGGGESKSEQHMRKVGALVETTITAGAVSSANEADELERIKAGQLVWVFVRNTRMAAFENEGQIELVINRVGCLDREVTVTYCTEDETAVAGEDYGTVGSSDPVTGTLTFLPDVTEQRIVVPIIDDNQWEPDETFLIKLSDPAIAGKLDDDAGGQSEVMLRQGMGQCIVTIIDDDEPGELGFFDQREYVVEEVCQKVELMVLRRSGADGKVTVHYETVAGSSNGEFDAVPGKDFKSASGTLVFQHQELSQTISVEIMNTGSYEKNVQFSILLTKPGGGAQVFKKGGNNFATVTISHDGEVANTVNKLSSVMGKRMEAFSVTSSSWREQFVEAFECEGGTDDDGEESDPGTFDYVMHFSTIGWKVLFAFIPPTDYCGGWATFFVSLAFIGGVTAVVGAFAQMFGCFYGLNDSVTAITFVALGTSLPDTFASAHAAKDDRTADAAIGNVTGSNSVNVFLGLGLPWVIAAVWAHSTNNINPATGEIGYYVPKAGGLSLSVAIFCVLAMICVLGLFIRRKLFGGELGGSKCSARISAVFFVSLWVVYIVTSILISEKTIKVPSWL